MSYLIASAVTSDKVQQLFAAPVSVALQPPGDYLSALSAPEQALSRKMGSRRVRGFSAGRVAARSALAQLGIEGESVLMAQNRSPIWPQGVCGSISHCQDKCLAVVARSSEIAGLGVDVEQLKALSQGVQKMILTDREIEQIKHQDNVALDPALLPCIIFSVKESVFKCLNPITQRWIDFHQAEISVHLDTGKIDIELDESVHTEQTLHRKLIGRIICTPDHVYSGVSLCHD